MGTAASQLAILPGVTHYNVFSSPALPGAVALFLEGRRFTAVR